MLVFLIDNMKDIINGSRECDWKLNVITGNERLKCVEGFQKSDNQCKKFNCGIFEYFNYKNAFVQLNNKRYPDHEATIQNVNKLYFNGVRV